MERGTVSQLCQCSNLSARDKGDSHHQNGCLNVQRTRFDEQMQRKRTVRQQARIKKEDQGTGKLRKALKPRPEEQQSRVHGNRTSSRPQGRHRISESTFSHKVHQLESSSAAGEHREPKRTKVLVDLEDYSNLNKRLADQAKTAKFLEASGMFWKAECERLI